MINFNSKIYVAGHTGLVGSAIVRKLKNKGYKKIIFLDRKKLDLTNQSKVFKYLKKNKPQFVFIAAAKVGGIYSNLKHKAQFITENLQIQTNLIHGAYLCGIKNLIFLGSSCIYPSNIKKKISEGDLLKSYLEKTNEAYAIAKIAGIKLCEFYNKQYKLNYLSLMPTNLYGPNDNFSEFDSHVIPGLITRMHLAKINNHPDFNIWGTGSPKREFLHVDDLANAIFHLIDTETNEKLLNIGSGREVTIKDLAKKIQDVVGYEGEVSFDSKMPDGNPRKLLDSNLISSLGWKPSIDLEEGLDSTYKWFLKNLS